MDTGDTCFVLICAALVMFMTPGLASFYGGLVNRMPWYAAVFMLFTMGNVGLPGTSGFVGEILTMTGAYGASTWTAIVAATGVILSAVYGLRAVAKIFFGQPTELHAKYAAANPTADLSWSARLPALVLFAALFFLGFWPKALTAPLNETLGTIYPALESAVKVATNQ